MFPGSTTFRTVCLKAVSTLVLVLLFQVSGFSAIYYVSATGNDINAGTLGSPYKTIQKAATAMVAGDICYIRQGTYRETIIPTNSGTSSASITFVNYPGESPVVSGADAMGGWTVHNGSIYKTAMAWTMGEGLDQVFVNGKMMNQARFPNSGLNPLQPTFASSVTHKYQSDTVYCQAFNQAAGFWNGGIVWGLFGLMWTSSSAKIASSTPNVLKCTQMSSPFFPDAAGIATGTACIIGVLNALDTATEWHYQNSTLYLWAPGNVNPSTSTVEVKRRNLVADLTNKSYIKLKGLNFFCGSITMAGSGGYCIIDSCSMKYLSHYTYSRGYGSSGGIAVSSTRNQIINSELVWSAGCLISLGGSYNTVKNCLLHDCNYVADYSSTISMNGNHNVVERNTLYNSKIAMMIQCNADTIRYNDISKWGYLVYDLGGLYTCCNHNGNGTSISYNWMHDEIPNGCPYGGAIYLDRCTNNYLVHHNVFFAVKYGVEVWGVANKVYNNTGFNLLANNGNGSIATMVQCECTPEMDEKNSLYLGKTPETQLVDAPSFDFRPKQGAAAINTGVAVAGITDGFIGSAPDLGAYEYDGPVWRAGQYSDAAYAATPSISPASGKVLSPLTVRMSSYTSQAQIYYTTDGSDPTQSSTLYSAALTFPGNSGEVKTLKARAFAPGLKPSPVQTVTYTFDAPNRGLKYSIYQGVWSVLPNFTALTPVKTGTCSNFAIRAIKPATDSFAIVFEGFINIPVSGIYQFMTQSDEGSKLFIGTTLIVNNDSLHFQQAKYGQIQLTAGLQPVRVEYFDVDFGGGLTVQWKIPGTTTSVAVPDSALFLAASGSFVAHRGSFLALRDKIVKVRIYTVKGELLNVWSRNDIMNISHQSSMTIPAGCYIVKIHTAGHEYVSKIVVAKQHEHTIAAQILNVMR